MMVSSFHNCNSSYIQNSNILSILELRKYFIRFRLLPPTAGFPEMAGVRMKISSDLNKLFCLAKHQISTSRQTPTSGGSLVLANPVAGSIW